MREKKKVLQHPLLLFPHQLYIVLRITKARFGRWIWTSESVQHHVSWRWMMAYRSMSNRCFFGLTAQPRWAPSWAVNWRVRWMLLPSKLSTSCKRKSVSKFSERFQDLRYVSDFFFFFAGCQMQLMDVGLAASHNAPRLFWPQLHKRRNYWKKLLGKLQCLSIVIVIK